MNTKAMSQRVVAAFLTLVFLTGFFTVRAENLQSSSTGTKGIPVPSMGEALGRYPDSVTVHKNGSFTEMFSNVSERDSYTFINYLRKKGAQESYTEPVDGILYERFTIWGEQIITIEWKYNYRTGESWIDYRAGYFDEWTENANAHFDAAQKLLAEGKEDEACAEIMAIPRYSVYGPAVKLLEEEENLAKKIKHETKTAPFKKVGNIVTFGTYIQKHDEADQTPIKWIVLDYDETNNRALLLSLYGLDVKPYNSTENDTTWEMCSLRAWLNNDFLNTAFSAEDQSSILTTEVDNSASQGFSNWNSSGGNNTQDRIFLLSCMEANLYLGVTLSDGNNTRSRAAPTSYAENSSAVTSRNNKTADGASAGWWWLRSSGYNQNQAAYVVSDGSLYCGNVNSENELVRPALWIDLSQK